MSFRQFMLSDVAVNEPDGKEGAKKIAPEAILV